jgi:hypothetical protein
MTFTTQQEEPSMQHMLVTSLAVKAARLLIGIMLLASFVSLSPPRGLRRQHHHHHRRRLHPQPQLHSA